MTLLKLEGVAKSFGAVKVLEDIDLSFEAGSVTALLGDNGAGKSTLIKLISGYHMPTKGNLVWEGAPISFSEDKGPREARDLGIETVYQHLNLVDQLSIVRNFFLGRELTKRVLGIPFLDLEKMSEIAREALEAMGLKRKLNPHDPVSFLSGGERQAIAISRARYFGAKLLILDEPTSALSVTQTEQVLRFAREAADGGLAVILITHTLDHVKQVADRVTVLYRGTSIGDFATKEVSEKEVAHLMTRGVLEALV